MWEKECKRKVRECGLQCVRPQLNGGTFGEGWMTLNEVSEGREWTVKEWKAEIDRRVKEIRVEKVANGNGDESNAKLVQDKGNAKE